MSRAWLFPGQGTQRRNMGAELFERYPALVSAADRILGYSLRELCLQDPGERLSTTEFCQPALFAVTALAFLEKRRSEPWPDFVAGHSLGEYCALFAAGCFDFETGLRLVHARARCMAAAGTGAMLAVIGPDLEQLRTLLAELRLDGLDIANYNLPTQVVLAGPEREIADLDAAIVGRGLGRSVHLHVGGAFHSRYAKAAAERFRDALGAVEFADPKVTTVSSVTGRPYRAGSVRELLETQILQPVRWVDVMQFLRDRGVTHAEQIGPGRVLDGLWERFELTIAQASAGARQGSALV